MTDNQTATETILDEAARLTSADRQKQYGHPALHHTATIEMIKIYVKRTGKTVGELDAVDWQAFMIFDKMARLANQRKRDTVVDIVGYARCIEKTLAESDPAQFKD